jgi:hypothetical protein
MSAFATHLDAGREPLGWAVLCIKAPKERSMKVHEIIFRKNGKNTDS